MEPPHRGLKNPGTCIPYVESFLRLSYAIYVFFVVEETNNILFSSLFEIKSLMIMARV